MGAMDRITLRSASDVDVVVHPSAHPDPQRVEPGGVVEVDAWAVESLTGGGLFKTIKTTTRRGGADPEES